MTISVTNKITKRQLAQLQELVSKSDDFIINQDSLEWSYEDDDLFLFFLDHRIIGLAITNIKNPTTLLSEFLIFKSFRDSGFGSEIYNHLQAELYNTGTKLIKLHSVTSSEGFWKKMGFKMDPSAKNNLPMLFKSLIQGNKTAIDGEVRLCIWDSHNKKGTPLYKNLSLNDLAIPCFMDWYIEVKENNNCIYSGKAKYCKLIKYYNDCLFSIT